MEEIGKGEPDEKRKERVEWKKQVTKCRE